MEKKKPSNFSKNKTIYFGCCWRIFFVFELSLKPRFLGVLDTRALFLGDVNSLSLLLLKTLGVFLGDNNFDWTLPFPEQILVFWKIKSLQFTKYKYIFLKKQLKSFELLFLFFSQNECSKILKFCAKINTISNKKTSKINLNWFYFNEKTIIEINWKKWFDCFFLLKKNRSNKIFFFQKFQKVWK